MDPIQSKLIYVDTKEEFEFLNNSTNHAFRNLSIVFIGDTLEFWTHGKLFCSSADIPLKQKWQLNTKDLEGYVTASGTLTDGYWGVPIATTDVPNPEPQWLSFGTWDINHGGTGKNSTDWSSALTEAGIEDIVLVSKTTAETPVVSFSTLGTTSVDNNNNRQVLANDTSGIHWYSESVLSVARAAEADLADSLSHTLIVNGYEFDGTEDLDSGIVDIAYGGTSKTDYALNGTSTNAWFLQSEFDVGSTSYVNKLVTIYGESDGSYPTDIHFSTTDIPTLSTGEYALVNTNAGLSWTNLGVYLQAASAMVFKGTVNCNVSSEITDSSYSAKALPWTTAKIGYTYIVTDRDFEVVYTGDSHGSYGEVSVGDMIICLVSAEDNGGIAQWSIVQNKITDGITYGGTLDPLDTLLWPQGTGEQVNYIAMSCGSNPLQIKYYHDGTSGVFIDHDGWIHGKFYGDVLGSPNATAYAKWTTNEGLLTYSSASNASGAVIISTSSNNYILRLILGEYGYLVYSSSPIWDTSVTSNLTLYEFFELSGSSGSYTGATLLRRTSIDSMSTGATKTVVLACIGTGTGFVGASGTTVKTYAYTNSYSDASLRSGRGGPGGATNQANTLAREAYQTANSNPAIVLTLEKADDGFYLINSGGLYLNTSLDDSGTAATAGGTVYNPIYIDNEGYTRSTDIYTYNVLHLYTLSIDTSWSAETRNTKFDDIYDTYYTDGVNVAGYGKNLVIKVQNAYRLLGDEDTSTISGSILQWSQTSSTVENMSLLLSTTTNDLYYRGQNGETWGSWNKIAFESDLPTASTVSSWGFGTYTKPTAGIPNSDLEKSYITIVGNNIHLGEAITATTIGNALTTSSPAAYATSSGNADTVDSYHAVGQTTDGYIIKQGFVSINADASNDTWSRVATFTGIDTNNLETLLYISTPMSGGYFAIVRIRLRYNSTSEADYTRTLTLVIGNMPLANLRLYYSGNTCELFVLQTKSSLSARSIHTRVLYEGKRSNVIGNFVTLDTNTTTTTTSSYSNYVTCTYEGSASYAYNGNTAYEYFSSGILPITHGGTGTSTAPTLGGIIYGSSTTAYSSTAAGTSGQFLLSTGASAPTWVSIDKSTVGLGNVENKTLDTSVTSGSSNYITSGAVYTALLNGFDTNNAILFKGTYTPPTTNDGSTANGTFKDTSGTTISMPTTGGTALGWLFVVSSVGYWGTEKLEAGDLIISNSDNPGTTLTSYYRILKNINPDAYLPLSAGSSYPLTGQLYLGATTQSSITNAVGIHVSDIRNVTPSPTMFGNLVVNWYFDLQGPTGKTSWKSIMHVRGWTGDSFYSWELAGSASTSSEGLFFRDGNVTSGFGDWKTVMFTDNVSGGGSSWGSSITVAGTTLTIPSKPSYTLDDISDGSTRKLSDYATTSHSHTNYVEKFSSDNYDLNELHTSGSYRLGASPTNAPSGMAYGQVFVFSGATGSDTVALIAAPYSSVNWYIRSGTWYASGTTDSSGNAKEGSLRTNSWNKLLHSGNFVAGTNYQAPVTAGTGLDWSGSTLNHTNSITSGTALGSDTTTLTFGGTFTIPTITYDSCGHITGTGTTTMTMPTNPNQDTKVTLTSNSVSSYRKILLGSGTYSASDTTVSTSLTGQAYVTAKVSVLPSTGDLFAHALYAESDISYKTNIEKISDSIYSFNWKDTGVKSYGFIAQYLQLTNPELVNGETTLSVNYNSALALTIAKLENRVKELEDKLRKYENV